jgi:uncharacterized membrane protein
MCALPVHQGAARGARSGEGATSLARRGRVNVAGGERAASVAAGSVLVALGLWRRSLPGMLIAGLGSAMLYRGATGHCHAYGALGRSSAERANARRRAVAEGERVEASILIDRSADELYRVWRDLEGLPRILSHIESVKVLDSRRSRWAAQAPRIAGGRVEWEAEIVRDEPGTVIGWRSLDDADVDNEGEVRFERALGDRGTLVRVSLRHRPPAGALGSFVALLFRGDAGKQVREDLRAFKRRMEVGELVTIDGQPAGRCSGLARLVPRA